MKAFVLLGNAAVRSDLSAFVDGSDCVVRLNDCRNFGANTGVKTDMLVLNNTGDPARVKALGYLLKPRTQKQIERDFPYLQHVKKVFFARPSDRDCRAFLQQEVPSANRLRDRQLKQIASDRRLECEIARALGLDENIIEQATMAFYVSTWRKLLSFGQTDAIMPSTGIMALEKLVQMQSSDPFHLYIGGFTHEGWEGHPWELERKMVDVYIREGRVIPLDQSVIMKRRVPSRFRFKRATFSGQTIQELFFVSRIDLPASRFLREKYPASRMVFWDPFKPDDVALLSAARLARHIIAADELAPVAAQTLGRPVTRLSRFDPEFARRLAKQPSMYAPQVSDLTAPDSGRVMFCPFNNTHVRTLAPISHHVQSKLFALYGDVPGEQTEEELRSLHLPYTRIDPQALAAIRPSALVVAKDWSPEARQLISMARRHGIPTVCVQEGPVEFNRGRRMQYCDYALIQGSIMMRYLDQPVYFITGNPRFDPLAALPRPAVPRVMLNCNFWNHHAERIRWIESAVAACRSAGVDYFISRHPRDRGRLPGGLPVQSSGPSLVHRQLAESSVVITPHSSIIYEALIMGRSVICHDPRHGYIDAFADDHSGAFRTTRTVAELHAALSHAISPPSGEQCALVDAFLGRHCGSRDGLAAARCAAAIAAISRHHDPANADSRVPGLRDALEAVLSYRRKLCRIPGLMG